MGPLGALPEPRSMPKVAWSGGARDTPQVREGRRPCPSAGLGRPALRSDARDWFQ